MRQTTRTPASAASLPEDSWENIPTGINPELTKIAKALRKVPKEYRAEDFNPLPKVGEILLSSQESQKVRIAEIEKLSSQLDAHTNTVSDIYWEGFNKSIKSYSSIISHITNAQHNVQDLQGLLYTIEKVHGQESVLKGAFSQQPEDESSTNNDSSNSSSGGRGPPSSLTASADNSSAPPLQQQSQPPDGGNGKKGENNDAMKVTIRKTITTSAENVLSTKESKTKLTSLYSRYLESCETLALYDKIIVLRDSEKAEREFENAGYFLHAAYMSKIGFETYYGLERGVQETLCVKNLMFAINNNKMRLNEAICKKLIEHIYYRRGKVSMLDIPSESKDKTGHFKLSREPSCGYASKEVMDEDLSRHPEADTGVFMRNCVHALSLIGKLSNAVEDIKRGLRTEINMIFNPLTIAFALKEKNVELLDGREMPEFSKDVRPAGTTLEAMLDRCAKIINNLSFIGNSIRSFDQSTSFSAKEMWTIMQSEITKILFKFLEDPIARDSAASMSHTTFSSSMIINSITEGENKGSKASSLQQQQQQQHQQHQQQQQQQRQQTIITTEKEILEAIKNPRNITVLNPLLRKFNADVGTMVGCEDSIEESKIATTLNDYIENFYIKYATIVLGKRASKVFIQKPTLRNLPPDLARKSSSSSNRGDGRRGSSSKRRKGGSGSSELGSSGRGGGDDEGEEGGGGDDDDDESFYIGTKKVLDSVLSVYQIVRMIVKDLTAMPRFGDKFIAILNSILNKFHGYCETMYNECIPPGSEAVKFLTGKNEKEVTDFLHHDPSWVRVGSSASVSHSRAQSSALSSSSSAAAPVQPSRVFSSTAAAVTAASSAATAIRSRAMSGTGGTGIPAAGAVTGMGSGVVPGGKRSAGTVFSEAEQLDEIRRFQPSAIISTENRIAPTALIMDADTTIRLSDLHNSLDWFVYRLYLLVGFTDAGGGEGSGNSSSNTGGALGADFVSTRSNQRNTFKMYLKRVTMYVPTAVSAASAVVSAAEGYGKDHGPRPRASVALTQGKGGGMPNGPTTTAAAAVAKLQQQLKAAESAERSLSLAILNFTGLFSKVCEQAIFTLRVDLKFQCVYFLSLCRKHCYYCDESEILADSCVIELNHRLAATEKALNLHLQPRRMKFVISGIAPLICDVMINTASSIKKVNNPGIRKLLRNVFAIQQNLGPIVARKEAFFDRVRQYYEMLYLSDYSELYAHVAQRIADGKPVFNVEQYVTILEIIRPGKKPDAESTRQLQTLLLSYI